MFLLNKKQKGFTLVEVVVGSAVFLVIAIGAYNAYVGLLGLINQGKYRVLAVSLANEQFEIARNMPYADVGIVGGIPKGKLLHEQNINRGGAMFKVVTTIRNLDLPFDGTFGGSPNDLSPSDNKYIDITVFCDGCKGMQPVSLTGQIAPKNLETASTNGALLIKVFDSNGQPVQNADIHIVNVATTTTIVIDDVTDSTGSLQIVDVPPGTNAYRITVTKDGYSTDRTYPIGGVGNPSPSKPDATVLLQQLTQISFSIDILGTINFSSVSPTCEPKSGFDFTLRGAKLIGTNTYKYSANKTTDSGGLLNLNNMEWDGYTIMAIDADYDLAGINPLNPVSLNPGSTQNIQLILVDKDEKSILVTVKDNATGLPVSDAQVILSKNSFQETKTTGKGYINQTDWSGGVGQSIYSNTTKYWADDGNTDTISSPGDIHLTQVFGAYNPSGYLESSSFDTGSESNFFTLIWSPTDQPILAGNNPVRFQLASNATITPTTTWSYIGPDGTNGTYYNISNTPISSNHANNRYLRYKLFLNTETSTVTPSISDTAFTFTSSCTPPGQVIFSDLSSGNYDLIVTKSGYSTYYASTTLNIGTSWTEQVVNMTP
jgi:prepilin-type N-terminal cleavage/methylation domain-containing protein